MSDQFEQQLMRLLEKIETTTPRAYELLVGEVVTRGWASIITTIVIATGTLGLLYFLAIKTRSWGKGIKDDFDRDTARVSSVAVQVLCGFVALVIVCMSFDKIEYAVRTIASPSLYLIQTLRG